MRTEIKMNIDEANLLCILCNNERKFNPGNDREAIAYKRSPDFYLGEKGATCKNCLYYAMHCGDKIFELIK